MLSLNLFWLKTFVDIYETCSRICSSADVDIEFLHPPHAYDILVLKKLHSSGKYTVLRHLMSPRDILEQSIYLHFSLEVNGTKPNDSLSVGVDLSQCRAMLGIYL